jgi:hypothetical protein
MRKSKFNYILVSSVALLFLWSCKGAPEEQLSMIKSSLTETHKLKISFEPGTGNLLYLVKGSDGIELPLTDVTLAQVATEEFKLSTVETDAMIPAGDTSGAPKYDIQVVLHTGEKCRSINPVYIGIVDAGISCEGAPSVTATETSGSAPAPTPGTSPAPSSEGEDRFATASQCTGYTKEDYLLCRFFDGGKGGCYDKYGCIVSLTPAQCQAEIDKLNADENVNHHKTTWNCSE